MSKDKIIIEKMIQYAQKSISYVQGISYEQFLADEKTMYAVVFTLSQLGELVTKLSTDVKEKNPNIPWASINGLRNRIVHDYDGVKLERVWQTVNESIPDLLCGLGGIQ
ncbi:MAG: DUF86 domain-containing protein [Defluviitaleaceae bacterium]|nr:DUF86 domain-containing protein [Defluviitaleaceae bacterium]